MTYYSLKVNNHGRVAQSMLHLRRPKGKGSSLVLSPTHFDGEWHSLDTGRVL